MRRVLFSFACLALASPAAAQDAGARVDGGRPVPSAAEIAGQPLPEGHPPIDPHAGDDPHTGSDPHDSDPHAGDPHGDPHGGAASMARILRPPELGSAEPSVAVPVGSIRVTVVDVDGRPIPDAAVDLGVRTQSDDRTRHNARTDASGRVLFERLETGTAQAYRINVPYLGATYSSAPFQLPTDQGYEVRITRLPVTREDRFVFFHLFRVAVELRDDRLHVIHQAEVTNAGHETFVFPVEGLRAPLPPSATAFQSRRVMTDQRVDEVDGSYVLRGSLPPGTSQLAWAYDLPITDETMRIPVSLPLRFFGIQVFSEAPDGLVMDVSGMPDPQRIDNEGQRIWLTQLRRAPTDAPIERITVTISGIPQPGPLRWIAVGLAIVFVLAGVVLRLDRVDDREAAKQGRQQRREELLAEIHELEREFETGEVGPEFRQTRRAEIVRELASLLHEEEAAKETGKDSASRDKVRARPAASR